MASEETTYSERVAFRLREDHLDYIDKLADSQGCRRSAVLRDMVTTHKALMTSSLSELLQGSPLEDVTLSIPNPEEEEDGSD